MKTPAEGRWDPGQYHKFSDHRRRPAVELLARVPPEGSPGLVVDLGCGSGEITRLIAARWPGAVVQGVDNSPDMLARARAANAAVAGTGTGSRPGSESGSEPESGPGPGSEDTGSRQAGIEWIEANIAGWSPPSPPGLLYANASLQWVDGHETLFPRLFRSLPPGGILAVQMPRSREARSHLLMHEILASGGPGGEPIGPVALRREMARKWVLDPETYHELLSPDAEALDIWTTEYLQVLEGDDPVLEWVRGTGLRPVLNGLAEPDLVHFLDAYRPALRNAYPRRADGATLYPFPRLFIVATRA